MNLHPFRGIGWRAHRREVGLGLADRHFALLTTAPTIALMLVVFGVPLIVSLVLSTQQWTINSTLLAGDFVGAANYADLLGDDHFLSSARLTIFYTIGAVAIEMVLGLGIALLLNMDLKGVGFFRAILVIPMMMTPIVAAVCWKLLLDAHGGVINYFFGAHTVWLGDPHTALLAVGLVNVWQNTPFVAVLLLAGLRSLPNEPLEAAAIDGAGAWATFWHILLPLLRPYILIALLLRTIFEFRSFDNVYVMTFGGPADSTMLLSIFTYLVSFTHFDLSLGAAASWIMLTMVLLLCAALVWTVRRGIALL